MPRWSWVALLLILAFDVWLRGHTFGPTFHERWGVNLWPENGPAAATEPLDCDEAAYAYMGRRMAAGDVLYRDLTENKPPLGYWLYAATVALGGANELTIRVMPLPFVLATIVLVWWIGLRVRGPSAACLAAWVFALLSTDPFVYGNGANMEHFLNAFAVAFLAALIWAWNRPGRFGLVLAGVFLGAACLVKQVAVVHLAVYLLAVMLRPGRSLGTRAVDGLALVAGVATVVAFAGVVVLAQRAGSAAVDDVLVYGRAIAADTPPEPGAPSVWIRWLTGNADPKGNLPWPFGHTDYLVWWGTGAWPLWAASSLVWAWIFVRSIRPPIRAEQDIAAPDGGESGERKNRRLVILIALWTLSACAQVVLPGMYWAHYYMLPLPGLALVFAIGCADAIAMARAPGRVRWIGRALAPLLLLSLVATAVIQARDYLGNAPQDLAKKYKGGTQWVVLRDFGRELAERKRVWSDPHLYVWGWQSPLHIYGGLDSVSRHFFADELIKIADRGFPNVRPATRKLLERRTEEIMEDLRARPPELILAGHPPFPALAQFLRERYLRSRLDRSLPDGRGLWVERSRYGAFETTKRRQTP